MKLKVDNQILKFENGNKAIIYYKDFIKMNEFIDSFLSNIKKGNYFLEIDNNFFIDDYIFANINLDLKKEFTLSKTSNLRKEIIRETIDFIEKNNIRINDFVSEDNIKKVSNYLKEKISSDKYKLILKNKIEDTTDIIDSLFNLEIEDDNGNYIVAKNFNQWNLSDVYFDMILNKEIKNKLIIINDYDQFSTDNGKKVLELINKLEKNNIIILITRNTHFLNNHLFINNLYFFENNILNKIYLPKSILYKYILLKDYKGDELSFDNYEIMSKGVIDNLDLDKSIKILSSLLKNIFNDLFMPNKINVSYLNENSYFLLKLFLLSNKKILKAELDYDLNLSNLIKYLFKKYLD